MKCADILRSFERVQFFVSRVWDCPPPWIIPLHRGEDRGFIVRVFMGIGCRGFDPLPQFFAI